MNIGTLLHYECFAYCSLQNGDLVVSGGIDLEEEEVVRDTRWFNPQSQ